jgi:hypothetical protein
MHIVFSILTTLGLIIVFVGWIWLLFLAFQVSALWGFGCLFPPVLLIFVINYWDDVKQPALIVVGGNVLLIVARSLV